MDAVNVLELGAHAFALVFSSGEDGSDIRSGVVRDVGHHGLHGDGFDIVAHGVVGGSKSNGGTKKTDGGDDQQHLCEGIVRLDGRRGNVVATPPEHELFLAVFSECFPLVFALKCPVMALVQSPRASDGNPLSVRSFERQLTGANSTGEQRCVDDVGEQT